MGGRSRRLEPLHKLAPLVCALIVCLPCVCGAQTRRASLARADRIELRAKALFDAGRYDEGIRLETQALEIRVKVLGPIDPAVAVALDNLAALYAEKGDYVRAEQLLDLAWQIAEQTLPPEHPYSTRILNDQASTYDDRGDYARSKELYQRVLTLREGLAKQRPFDAALSDLCKHTAAEPAECQWHLDVALTLNDIAAVSAHEGDFDQAERLFKRALELNEKLLPPEHPDLVRLLNNIAFVHSNKDDIESAEGLYERVLNIRLKHLGQKHPLVALSLNNLGTLYTRKGEIARAEETLNRAWVIAREVLPAEHGDAALILGNLAALAVAKGESGRAVGLLKQAAGIQEHRLSLILTIGSEKQKQLYLDTLVSDTNQAVSLHVVSAPRDEAAARLALTTILERKGRTLDAMTDQLGALRRAAAPQDRKLLNQLLAVGTRLANRLVSGPEQGKSPDMWRLAVSRDADEVERLEGEIGRRSTAFRAQVSRLTLEAVREQIPADAALVEFFKYQPFDPSARKNEARWGPPRYVAYILRRDAAVPQGIELGAAAAIEEKVRSLRVALRNPNDEDNRALAADLSESVLHPILRALGQTRHLILSPDGALNLIPFAALIDERGRYLVENYSLTYLTSGRDLLRLRSHVASQSGPLILADPDYEMRAALVNAGRRRSAFQLDENRRAANSAMPKFTPLRGTRDEAAALTKLFPDARVLTQAQATESALKQARGPRLLHIATHGFFLMDDLQPAAAAASGVSGQPPSNTSGAQTHRAENPLLRSVLALSGANHLRGGGGQDGILTGLEAARLNLLGTKLVVLSACETGLGSVQDGNGVYGLRRALVLAGSESQLISLWKVNDETTRDFMIRYYDLLLAGQGRSEALRRVQLEMLASDGKGREISHPYYWASFIQSGEWKNLSGHDGP
jgi:CHAT domain-containing protein/tetratricopeptide (TPR) repeat protein